MVSMSGQARSSLLSNTLPMNPVPPVTNTLLPLKNSGIVGVAMVHTRSAIRVIHDWYDLAKSHQAVSILQTASVLTSSSVTLGCLGPRD